MPRACLWLKKTVGVLSYALRQRETAVEKTFLARDTPNYYYLYTCILYLLVTACQGTSPDAEHAVGPSALQARTVVSTSPANHRTGEEITIIDFKEVYLGAQGISVPWHGRLEISRIQSKR